MNYFTDGKLDNTVYDIDENYLKKMLDDNARELKESVQLTNSSYKGESYYNFMPDFHMAFDKEILERDQRTAGMKVQYPHGIMIRQPALRNYYRGENQIYQNSIPSLLRKLNQFSSEKDKALYRIVADMRIAEFKHLIDKFDHVKNWNYGDVLYELLAQHYGLETGWLDITSDFRVALFFATCYYDNESKRWLPLDQKHIDENPYGMIFHMPAWQRTMRWTMSLKYFESVSHEVAEYDSNGEPFRYKLYEYPIFQGIPDNLIYPIGFQPFMRCAMQYGYGIYMRVPQPLQQDYVFEKLRFKHSVEFSRKVYDLMQGGELIYPHEGLRDAEFIIDNISKGTVFSEEAFKYALYRSHEYALADEDKCRSDLLNFKVNGKKIEIVDYHPYKISSGRRKRIDSKYADFSLEKNYGLKIMFRGSPQQMQGMFEPWMIPDKENQPGVVDFKPREIVPNLENLWSWNSMALLHTVMFAQPPEF